MKKLLHGLDEYLEEVLLVILLACMAVIMGIQVFCRYVLSMSLSWSEELTRYLFIWAGFLSISYCTKRCISIKIEQFVALFPKRGKALFKVINHTVELVLFSISCLFPGDISIWPLLPDRPALLLASPCIWCRPPLLQVFFWQP